MGSVALVLTSLVMSIRTSGKEKINACSISDFSLSIFIFSLILKSPLIFHISFCVNSHISIYLHKISSLSDLLFTNKHYHTHYDNSKHEMYEFKAFYGIALYMGFDSDNKFEFSLVISI